MSVRGDFRASLQASLAAVLQIDFQPGPIEGPLTDRNLGCVWWERKRPFSRDGNLEEDFYVVRVFKLFKLDQGAIEPRQTIAEHLEDVAEELEAALQAVLTTSGHWFFNVLEVAPNYTQQAVEARLTAYDRNRSSAGG